MQIHAFLNWQKMVCKQLHTSVALLPRNELPISLIQGMVGPTAGLNTMTKRNIPPGNNLVIPLIKVSKSKNMFYHITCKNCKINNL
jgi:hypothetical protein